MDFKYEDLGGTTERIVRQLQSLEFLSVLFSDKLGYSCHGVAICMAVVAVSRPRVRVCMP